MEQQNHTKNGVVEWWSKTIDENQKKTLQMQEEILEAKDLEIIRERKIIGAVKKIKLGKLPRWDKPTPEMMKYIGTV